MKINRSVLIGVTFAYLVSLLCGFLVANILSEQSYKVYVTPTFEAMDRLELEEATATLQREGPAALASYMGRLDRAFGGRHFLLSSTGIDLSTGTSNLQLLPKPPASRYRGYIHGTFHLAQRSDDGQFWFAVEGTSHEEGPVTWPYFLVCVFVTTGLLFFSLLYLVFPLRRIRDALVEFGHGEMSRRLSSKREDEIGQLTVSFNAMAEQIERSFRTERALLQDVSHELRAPLARLSLAVHLAKQEHGDDELLTQIDSNVRRLTSLVGEITAFHQTWSMSENDHPLESVDLDQIIRQVVQESTIEATMHSVELEVSSHPVVLHRARPDLIARVVENILRNAILHSWQGSRIEVCVREEGESAVITVRDFGRGVAADVLERIFEPFYREQEAGSSPGLGLGLSIARRGAQWHGGTLLAENADPGLKLIASFPLQGVTAGSGA